MPPSSRASIPPYSRPPNSSRSGAVTPDQIIWHRHLFAGALAGLALSTVAMATVLSEGAAAWQPLLLSAIFSTALSSFLLGAVGAVVFCLAHAFPRSRTRAAQIAGGVSTLVLVLYVMSRATAESFRFASGSTLNVGTVEFLAAGLGHLLVPVAIEYAPLTALIVLFVAGTVFGAYSFLRRPVEGPQALRGLFLRGVGSVVVLVLLLRAFSTPGVVQEARLNQTADLSFLASIASRAEEERRMADEAQEKGVVVPRGPKREAGLLWEKTVTRMEGPRPNFVLVMMESVGTNHLGYFGYERPTTENLDRIAKKSRRFRNARTTASHSNYAQMAVLSSLFPRRYSGLDTYRRLDYPRVLWHDFFGVLGYKTATHSSQDETWQGMIRFQTTDTPTEFNHAGTYEGQKVRMGSESIVPDEVTVTRAIEWIDRNPGPFGVYVNLQATHFPYRVPPGVKQPYQPIRPTRGKFHYLGYPKGDTQTVKNRFDNALTYVDRQIGRLYDFLSRTGRLDDTIFVVTSDHGELFWDHDMVTHGRSLVEEEVRVPLLIHYPGRVAAEDDFRTVSTLDVLPTVASLLEVPAHPAFQGHSLFDDGQEGEFPVFMNIQSMKSQDAVVCGAYKFVHNRSEQENYLYDWTRDPSESHDLSEKLPQLAEKLRVVLSTQMREQQGYYSPWETEFRDAHYAPRLASCPSLETKATAVLSDQAAPRAGHLAHN